MALMLGRPGGVERHLTSLGCGCFIKDGNHSAQPADVERLAEITHARGWGRECGVRDSSTGSWGTPAMSTLPETLASSEPACPIEVEGRWELHKAL